MKQNHMHTHRGKDKKPYAPKLTKSIILVCRVCDTRYIRTRSGQDNCLKCFVQARDERSRKAGSPGTFTNLITRKQ